MSRILCWSLCSLALGLAACGHEAEEGQWPMSKQELSSVAPDVTAGEATYRRYCVGCHGADGRGNGGTTGANFTAADSPLSGRSVSDLVASVRDGKRGERGTMPAHSPVLTDAQITAVVDYVRTRFAPKPAQEPTAAP